MCFNINSPVRTLFAFLFVFIVNISLSMLGLSTNYSIISSFIIVFLFFGLPLYTPLLETDLDRLEKFLIAQRKNPAFYILYASSNRQDEEVERLMPQLLLKYKQRHRQALYMAFHGAYRKDVSSVKNQIVHIRPMDYQHYYAAFVHLEEGNIELARSSAARVSKPWMKNALLSEIEEKTGNQLEAASYAKKALLSSRGLQRYVLHKHYERELPEALAG